MDTLEPPQALLHAVLGHEKFKCHPRSVFCKEGGQGEAPKSLRFAHKEQLTRKAPEIVFVSLRMSAGTSFLKIPAHLQKTFLAD